MKFMIQLVLCIAFLLAGGTSHGDGEDEVELPRYSGYFGRELRSSNPDIRAMAAYIENLDPNLKIKLTLSGLEGLTPRQLSIVKSMDVLTRQHELNPGARLKFTEDKLIHMLNMTDGSSGYLNKGYVVAVPPYATQSYSPSVETMHISAPYGGDAFVAGRAFPRLGVDKAPQIIFPRGSYFRINDTLPDLVYVPPATLGLADDFRLRTLNAFEKRVPGICLTPPVNLKPAAMNLGRVGALVGSNYAIQYWAATNPENPGAKMINEANEGHYSMRDAVLTGKAADGRELSTLEWLMFSMGVSSDNGIMGSW